MHAMFPPKQKVSYKDNKKKFYKPSIEQSIQGFIHTINSAEDIQEKVAELRQEYDKVNLKLQPMIFKMINFIDGKYAVVYNDYYFGFNDILLAVDCCFKMFYVFHLEFQFESIRFWKFLANFFYNIQVDDRSVLSVTKEFKQFLKSN